MRKPKILVLDIETSPVIAQVWQLWDQNVGLNQIQADWYVLSWAAKWLGEPQVMQYDQRNRRPMSDDKQLLKRMWKLLDKADIIVTKNGKMFDIKKLYARFIQHGFQPPSPFKHEDVGIMAKSQFGFTSSKLEYLTDKLCKKYKKQAHKLFPGHELWSECLKRNPKAWAEMAKYNIYDVLSLEELYLIMRPWATGINVNLYHDGEDQLCNACGGAKFQKRGFAYTGAGKYQIYWCLNPKCGVYVRGRTNLFTPDKRKSLKVKIAG